LSCFGEDDQTKEEEPEKDQVGDAEANYENLKSNSIHKSISS